MCWITGDQGMNSTPETRSYRGIEVLRRGETHPEYTILLLDRFGLDDVHVRTGWLTVTEVINSFLRDMGNQIEHSAFALETRAERMRRLNYYDGL